MSEQPNSEPLPLRDLAGPIAAFAIPLVLCFVILIAFNGNLALIVANFVLFVVLGTWAIRRVKALERERDR